MLTGAVKANSNHLEPVPAYDSSGYNQAVFKSLIGNIRAKLWMVVRPSFSKEYAIILYEHKNEWRLEKVTAKEKIWAWKKADEGRFVLDIKTTKAVDRKFTIVDKEKLHKIVLAWNSALKTTRYSENNLQGMDGTTYQFYSHYQTFGQTWSPTEGLPLFLVNLGKKLEEIVTIDKTEREKALKKATDIAIKIIEITQRKAD